MIGQWKIAMQTMSVLTLAAPLAVVIGLGLGVTAWKFKTFDKSIRPILSILQTLPFFTYRLPAVIFFKVGPTAVSVATIMFAIPPMILMTTLGLRKVSAEIVEAGHMSGCTRWQMLSRVYIPAARTEILVGVNQVIMLCLAMVVLTAFIGMPGLGAKLLAMMGSFKIGRSFEIGITIVLFAIMLDRMSKAWVLKQPVHFDRGTKWWQRHKFFLLSLLAFLFFLLLSQIIPILAEVTRKQSFSQGKEIDKIIKECNQIENSLILYTIVETKLAKYISNKSEENNIPCFGILGNLILSFSKLLNQKAIHKPSAQHVLDDDYYKRIEAIQFTMAHDDGKKVDDINNADVILLGVSRTSKTPTSIYLANRGYKTVNIPLVLDQKIPSGLTTNKKSCIVGLAADPERLADIRRNRVAIMKDNNLKEYTDLKFIKDEVENSKKLFKKNNWPIIDVTRRSVEETAASILKIIEIKKNK